MKTESQKTGLSGTYACDAHADTAWTSRGVICIWFDNWKYEPTRWHEWRQSGSSEFIHLIRQSFAFGTERDGRKGKQKTSGAISAISDVPFCLCPRGPDLNFVVNGAIDGWIDEFGRDTLLFEREDMCVCVRIQIHELVLAWIYMEWGRILECCVVQGLI